MNNALETSHQLDFLTADDYMFNRFKIGTCHGQWQSTDDSYIILSVVNEIPGNGHLNDVFEWFEFSCKRDKKNLLVLEIMNSKFHDHLIQKRGFLPLDKDGENLIKVFNKKEYEKLLLKGNPILRAGSLKCV